MEETLLVDSTKGVSYDPFYCTLIKFQNVPIGSTDLT